MRTQILGLALIATMTSASAQVSMAVPGAVDEAGQARTGLLYNDTVRKDFEALRSTIKAGGK